MDADVDGEPFKTDWEHSSVVGQLMFSRQIDFDNAFLHETELSEKDSIHCTVPDGVEHPTHFNRDVVLKLKKSLFGMQDAPKFWLLKAKKGLT